MHLRLNPIEKLFGESKNSHFELSQLKWNALKRLRHQFQNTIWEYNEKLIFNL